jgi:hypothetical protein
VGWCNLRHHEDKCNLWGPRSSSLYQNINSTFNLYNYTLTKSFREKRRHLSLKEEVKEEV